MKGAAVVRGRMIMTMVFTLTFVQSAVSSTLREDNGNQNDTAYLMQQLHNGRIWEKRFDKVSGHEFFLTEALAEASITIGNRTFNGQLIWYDIYNDCIVLMVRPGQFIELSGENASQFTIRYLNREYLFRYFGGKGYCQLLHYGEVLLVRKYVKVIKKNAVDGSYDAFEEEISDYLVKDGRFTRFRTRKDLFSVVADRETEVRHYIRENDIWLNPKISESVIPVLEFYDSL
jgi:hypothetical protein